MCTNTSQPRSQQTVAAQNRRRDHRRESLMDHYRHYGAPFSLLLEVNWSNYCYNSHLINLINVLAGPGRLFPVQLDIGEPTVLLAYQILNFHYPSEIAPAHCIFKASGIFTGSRMSGFPLGEQPLLGPDPVLKHALTTFATSFGFPTEIVIAARNKRVRVSIGCGIVNKLKCFVFLENLYKSILKTNNDFFKFSLSVFPANLRNGWTIYNGTFTPRQRML